MDSHKNFTLKLMSGFTFEARKQRDSLVCVIIHKSIDSLARSMT